MYQDYLNEREKYRKRQLARQQRLPQKQLRGTNTAANRYIQQSRNFQRKTQRQFNGLLFTARAIAGTLRLVSNLMRTQVGMVMVGAVALISAFNHVKNLKEFNRQYEEEFAGIGSGMSSGRTSEQGIRDILQYEGFIPVAKDVDGDGVLTIGYGHRGKDVKPGQTITREQAFKLFQSDLKPREDVVKKHVKVPLSQNMFDALVSFVYNCGANNFEKSDTLKLLNQGKYKEAAERMKTEYINKGTKHEQGLRARRAKEAAKILNDLDSSGKIKEEISNPTKKYSDVQLKDYATKSDGGRGKADTTATSGKFGGYQTAKGVQVGRSAAKVLSQIEGSGTITSGLGDTHAKKSKHYTGHAVDVGMGGVGNDKVVETCINFLKHPAVAWVFVETFEKDLNWARGVEKAVRERVPQLCKGNRISSGTSEHVTGRHLHVEFDYNYMNKPQATYNIDKQNKPKPIPEKPKKKETKQKGKPTGGAANITIPEEETSSPRGLVNTGSVNIKSLKQTPNKTRKS